MAKVDDPHMGLINGAFLSHLEASKVAAASASNIGALPGILRYPCFARVSPDVSRNNSASSLRQNKWTTVLSNSDPEFGRLPVLTRIRSAMASFTFTLA